MSRAVKNITLYIVVVLAGLITSLSIVNLAWNQWGSKASMIILSLAENGSLGRISKDMEYQLFLVNTLDKHDLDALYLAHCFKMRSLIEEADPSLAEDLAQYKRLVNLQDELKGKLEELTTSGKCG